MKILYSYFFLPDEIYSFHDSASPYPFRASARLGRTTSKAADGVHDLTQRPQLIFPGAASHASSLPADSDEILPPDSARSTVLPGMDEEPTEDSIDLSTSNISTAVLFSPSTSATPLKCRTLVPLSAGIGKRRRSAKEVQSYAAMEQSEWDDERSPAATTPNATLGMQASLTPGKSPKVGCCVYLCVGAAALTCPSCALASSSHGLHQPRTISSFGKF